MDMTSERPQEVNFGVEFPPQSGNRLPLDPYRLLQVGRSASGADIRAAYLGRCADFHPDKHPVAWATAAAQAFVAVHDAYALLSDPVTRAAYDENREARGARDWVPAISGDPITTALRLAWDLRSLLPFVGELDALERAHGLEEGSLRVATSANCPCSATATAPGGTCATLPLPATPDRPNRGVLCTAHKLVHQCDSACTSPKTVCPMWARTLVESYRATVRGAWVLRTAGDTPTPTAFPGRQYWFNPCAGISAWLDGSTVKPTDSTDTTTTPEEVAGAAGAAASQPGPSFEMTESTSVRPPLELGVTPHVCEPGCRFTRPNGLRSPQSRCWVRRVLRGLRTGVCTRVLACLRRLHSRVLLHSKWACLWHVRAFDRSVNRPDGASPSESGGGSPAVRPAPAALDPPTPYRQPARSRQCIQHGRIGERGPYPFGTPGSRLGRGSTGTRRGG
eukprot:m.274890 g.274890  ORF g.274890 m.274890 type:complete len:450 (+) comp16135_c0_seq12:935-2284(+)